MKQIWSFCEDSLINFSFVYFFVSAAYFYLILDFCKSPCILTNETHIRTFCYFFIQKNPKQVIKASFFYVFFYFFSAIACKYFNILLERSFWFAKSVCFIFVFWFTLSLFSANEKINLMLFSQFNTN